MINLENISTKYEYRKKYSIALPLKTFESILIHLILNIFWVYLINIFILNLSWQNFYDVLNDLTLLTGNILNSPFIYLIIYGRKKGSIKGS